MTTPSPAVCPRCRARFPTSQRFCPNDGAALVSVVDDAAEAPAGGKAAEPARDTVPMPMLDLPIAEVAGDLREGEERLGNYRLLELVGEGGMARVYRAEHATLGRACAIKRLHASHFGDPVTVGRFLAEARAVGDIRHPNLAATYDVVEENDEIYIVMEYLEGRDLGQVLRDEGPLHPDRAARLVAQACDGLFAVHAQGIIHRDLKPDNLFVTHDDRGNERVKVLDFGVARLGEDRPQAVRTRTGQTVGTPQYMSPEQATAATLDGRSDIYMMGVVLFELLTGVPPFRGKSYGDVMLMHVHDPPPRPSLLRLDVPEWLEQVVMRCLEKEPERRYANMKELATALRRESTADVTLPVGKLPPPGAHPSRTWIVVGVAALALVLGGVGIALLSRKGPAPAPAPVAAVPTAAPAPAPAPTPPPMRTVHVITVPPGATVSLEGEIRCDTPCDVSLPVDAKGVTELVLSLDGYTAERRRVDLSMPPAEVRLVLKRRSRGKADHNATVDPFH